MEEHSPGFRFFPTEEELVSFYLHNKLQGKKLVIHRVIPVVKLYELEPWHLPKFSGELCQGDSEQWFFFTPRQEREANGGRPTRTTASGYWKATGSTGYVYSSDNRVIGEKKTMVFYRGKAPTGRKTKWKMNEYRAIEEEEAIGTSANPIPKTRHEFSLCRVYVVSGSLRAFDRRPSGAITREMVTPQLDNGSGEATNLQDTTSPEREMVTQQFDNGGGEATNLQITSSPETGMVTPQLDNGGAEATTNLKTSSPETTYSEGDFGDLILPDAAIGSDIFQMVNDLQQLWEWEEQYLF